MSKALRDLRVRAEMSGARLGSLAGMSQSKISKIECGRLVPSRPDITAIARALRLNTDVIDHLLSLAAQARVKTDEIGGLAGQKITNEIHERSSSFRYWVPSAIPAPLQSLSYAESVFRSSRAPVRALDRRMMFRLELQAKLYDNDKRFQFLMSEASLRGRPGQVSVLLEQLEALLSWCERPNVEMRFLRVANRQNWYVPGPFLIADNDVVAIEFATGSFFLDDPYDVNAYSDLFDGLWAANADYDHRSVIVSAIANARVDNPIEVVEVREASASANSV